MIELRKSRGLTQSDLAEMLRYSDKSISKWENGDSLPDISVLAELAALYGITLDDLVHENAADKIADKAAEKEGGRGKKPAGHSLSCRLRRLSYRLSHFRLPETSCGHRLLAGVSLGAARFLSRGAVLRQAYGPRGLDKRKGV